MHHLFQKYTQGICSQEEYREVLSFIQNPDNSNKLELLLLQNWEILNKKEFNIKPNSQLLDSIHHQIALDENKKIKQFQIYRISLAAAAILILVLLAAPFLFVEKSKPETITSHTIYTPYGGKTNFTLPDGSEVWLNSGSRIIYPERFENERFVELQGEAFFKIIKDNKPFSVKNRYGNIKVHGTEFNVKAYNNEIFEATLVKGSVTFETFNGGSETLVPGEQVYQTGNTFKIKNVETRFFTSWKDGQLIFRDEPFKNMIARLERWYNVEIKLKDSKLNDLKFTGTIEMESFSEVLELIKLTTPIRYSFDRKTRILSIWSIKK